MGGLVCHDHLTIWEGLDVSADREPRRIRTLVLVPATVMFFHIPSRGTNACGVRFPSTTPLFHRCPKVNKKETRTPFAECRSTSLTRSSSSPLPSKTLFDSFQLNQKRKSDFSWYLGKSAGR